MKRISRILMVLLALLLVQLGAMAVLAEQSVPTVYLDAVNGLHFLLPCTTDELVNKIHNHAVRNRLPMMGDITYKKIFKLMLFGAPLFAIYRQKPQNALWRSYKICLFDKIPVIKISTNKDEN